MSTSHRFAVAVHALGLLAHEEGEALKSENLAKKIGTNPVVIRRILGSLSKANLVISQTGSSGGTRLVRPPNQITMLDIYRAVEADNLFSLQLPDDGDPNCVIGKVMQEVLDEIVVKADLALAGVLAKITLDDVFQSALKRSGFDPTGCTSQNLAENSSRTRPIQN